MNTNTQNETKRHYKKTLQKDSYLPIIEYLTKIR